MVKIMVVDDNQDVRFTVLSSLKSFNPSYEFEEAENGDECLKKIREFKPDLILMDIMMPGMDGMETTIKIKQDPDFANVKIIYLTAKTDSLSKGMGQLSGEDYIEKPFESEDLNQRIQDVLSGKKQNSVLDE